jgi:O-antigen ligase
MVFENPRGWVPIHNTYLRIGVELGVEGLVLFGLLVWASVSNSFRAIKLRAADSQCVVLVAVSAALAGILVVGILADLAALSMFWFLLAFAERSATISLVRATAA